jgi:hypothetical protein
VAPAMVSIPGQREKKCDSRGGRPRRLALVLAEDRYE